MKRTPISKRQRWQILQRDGFKCRYCGRKAPEVKLEIDHQKPVAGGGCNCMSNLVAACFDCNRGKGISVIGQIDPESFDRMWYLASRLDAEVQRHFNDKTINIELHLLATMFLDGWDQNEILNFLHGKSPDSVEDKEDFLNWAYYNCFRYMMQVECPK